MHSFEQEIDLPASMVSKPFCRVSVRYASDGTKTIRAWLSLGHLRVATQTGIAIEGTSRMARSFGREGLLGGMRRAPRSGMNLVSCVVRKMGSYLARRCDADRHTTVLYWGTEADDGITLVGDFTAFQIEQQEFAGPEVLGRHRQLLPAVKYFVSRFHDSPWGIYYFLTAGRIDDFCKLEEYSKTLAAQIRSGRRKPVKFVIVGVGEQPDVNSLYRLDDLNGRLSVDMWECQIVRDMPSLFRNYPGMIDSCRIVASKGVVRDSKGVVVADFSKSGVPSMLRFTMPWDASCVLVDVDGSVAMLRVP